MVVSLPADLVLPDRPVGFVYVRSALKSEQEREREREAVDALGLRVRAIPSAKAVAMLLTHSFSLTPTGCPAGHELRPPQRDDDVRP